MRQWREDQGSGPVWVVEATSTTERDVLQARTDLLARLRHPGVVDLVDAGPALRGGWQVRTRWVPGSLRVLARDPDPEELAGLGAALANVVGDLHALGWVHGGLTVEHVLLDAGGRPVLCGLGSAQQTVDPVARAGDATDLLDTLRCLIPRGAATREWRRLCGVLQPPRRHIPDLTALAGRLASPRLEPRLLVPTLRPPDSDDGAQAASTILWDRRGLQTGVGRVKAAVEPSTAPRQGDDADREAVRPRAWQLGSEVAVLLGRRARTVAAGIVVATALALVAVIGTGLRQSHPSTSCPAVDSTCRALALPGGILTTAAGRFAVGSPGDAVVLGRWDCGPVSLPALLQPTDGDVWVFDRWPTPGADVAGRPLARVDHAVSLAVVPAPTGCDGLEVLRDRMGAVLLHPQVAG